MTSKSLAREGMVHPLSKKAAMDWHPATMEAGNFPQARLEPRAQGPWGSHLGEKRTGGASDDMWGPEQVANNSEARTVSDDMFATLATCFSAIPRGPCQYKLPFNDAWNLQCKVQRTFFGCLR